MDIRQTPTLTVELTVEEFELVESALGYAAGQGSAPTDEQPYYRVYRKFNVPEDFNGYPAND